MSSIYHLSWEEFHRDTRALAQRLLETGKPWRAIVAIARGGLVPAGILAREMNIRLVDTLCIASYDHTDQGNAQILKTAEGDSSDILLVDDLVDSGVTAQIARELLPQATLAVIYAKPKGKPQAHFWQRDFMQDIWIHFPWDCEQHENNTVYAEPLHKRAE